MTTNKYGWFISMYLPLLMFGVGKMSQMYCTFGIFRRVDEGGGWDNCHARHGRYHGKLSGRSNSTSFAASGDTVRWRWSSAISPGLMRADDGLDLSWKITIIHQRYRLVIIPWSLLLAITPLFYYWLSIIIINHQWTMIKQPSTIRSPTKPY